jgi:hypothetical protein
MSAPGEEKIGFGSVCNIVCHSVGAIWERKFGAIYGHFAEQIASSKSSLKKQFTCAQAGREQANDGKFGENWAALHSHRRRRSSAVRSLAPSRLSFL